MPVSCDPRVGHVAAGALFLLLAFGAGAAAQDKPTELTAEQRTILDRVTDYSGHYVAGLPNFECIEITRQFESGLKGKHWSKGDTLTSRLIFEDGREKSSLELVNNKAPRRPPRTPLKTEGEFGSLIARLFTSGEEVAFVWHDWDTVDGRRLAVFDYFIDRQHSTLRLSLDRFTSAVVEHYGSIWADPASGAILRLINKVEKVPEQLDTKSISTSVDFGPVIIAGKQYHLPVGASILLTTPHGRIRNELTFADYRKFEAESHITFNSDRGTAVAGSTGTPPQ